MDKLFGTDGVRGTANTHPMTAEMALRIGAAVGQYFRRGGEHAHRVVIGKDTRLSGYMFENALTAGLTSTGMNVLLLGPVPTPAVGLLTRSMRADLGVMISGSSGTGKELVARALHNFGHRKAKPFVAINMAALPSEAIETELFGRSGTSIGKFEKADGGTLFLDEVGDMPLDAQTRLLRVLQEGEFTPLGETLARRADVRIIAATHQDLRTLINEGKFREDLYYRLNVVPIRLPALRERIEDIPDLARHFLRQAEANGLARKTIAADALDILKKQIWPGNVRELENMMQRLAVLCPDEIITGKIVSQELSARPMVQETASANQPHQLSKSIEQHLRRYFDLHTDGLPPPGLYDRILKEVELPLIALSLAATRGNQLKTADLLGINRNTLRKKIKDLDIQVTRGKKLM